MTKVVPPALPPTHVRRTDVEQWLDRATTRRLTLVTGGPGWGKSVLLSGWPGCEPPGSRSTPATATWTL